MDISNVAIQGFFVRVTILTDWAGVSDLQVHGLHVPLQNVRSSKAFNALVTLVALSHMIDCKNEYFFVVKMQQCNIGFLERARPRRDLHLLEAAETPALAPPRCRCDHASG